jgi:hypothetical protein
MLHVKILIISNKPKTFSVENLNTNLKLAMKNFVFYILFVGGLMASCTSPSSNNYIVPIAAPKLTENKVSGTLKDVETNLATIEYVVLEKRNQETQQLVTAQLDKEGLTYDLSILRAPLEDYIKANPAYNLYIRLELRTPAPDQTAPDGKTLLNAGPVLDYVNINISSFTADGINFEYKDTRYNWANLNTGLKKNFEQAISRLYLEKINTEMTLSVYDMNNPKSLVSFKESIVANAPNPARVLTIGWNWK